MNRRIPFFSMMTFLVLILISTEIAQGSTTSTRERLIAQVTRLGGTIEFDETRPSRPIVRVNLNGTKVTDADLVLFEDARKDLKELCYLDLRLTKIGDEGIVRLKNLSSLQTMNLFRTQLGDKGLKHLKKLINLETLLIGGTKVSDAGLVHLRPFKKLQKLSLFQTQVSDEGIAQLKLMGSLEVLLVGGSKITSAGTEELQKALPKLRFTENT
jgi:Leucine-rich repeat (LRR) protein